MSRRGRQFAKRPQHARAAAPRTPHVFGQIGLELFNEAVSLPFLRHQPAMTVTLNNAVTGASRDCLIIRGVCGESVGKWNCNVHVGRNIFQGYRELECDGGRGPVQLGQKESPVTGQNSLVIGLCRGHEEKREDEKRNKWTHLEASCCPRRPQSTTKRVKEH